MSASHPSSDPHERLLRHGTGAFSDAELLAFILAGNTAQEDVLALAEHILLRYAGLRGLVESEPSMLARIEEVDTAAAVRLIAALELGRRLANASSKPPAVIETAADAAHLLRDMHLLKQEHVRVILLDSARRVIALPTLYIGTLNGSMLRVAEVFREAIAHNSAAIMLAHNHPSGDSTPSPEDVEITRAVAAAGRLLDIPLIDHLIMGRESWISLRDMGLLRDL